MTVKNLTVSGRLGRDAELKHTKSGEAVLNLNVAVDDRKKVNGEWVNETLWVGVTVFGKRGEGLAPLCKKGTRIEAAGELNVRTYEARDGGTKTAIECLANTVNVLFDKRADGGGQSAGRGQENRAAPHLPGPGYADGPDDYDDGSDLPF